METSGAPTKILPENAYRPLRPGEVYQPVVPASSNIAEVTVRSLSYGVVLTAVFAAAAAYIGFKTANAIETAIPIAILAVFFGRIHSRRNTLLENVIIQSMGQAAGVVVAGAGFTIPALYINQLHPNLFHAFLAVMTGGFLGILLLIPLRRYFVKDQHGLLPFPEATATTEILVTGEQEEGSSGATLLTALGIGAAFEFLVEVIHLWNAKLDTHHLFPGLYHKGMELRMEATATNFGLGYIIGIKYAAIIAAGSLLANLVFVPLVIYFGGDAVILPMKTAVSAAAPSEIWKNLVRPIGIGAIAVAGLVGILKMSRIILGSLSLGFKGLFSEHSPDSMERTDLDIKPSYVFLMELVMALFLFLVFKFAFGAALSTSILGAAIVLLLAFLFTPVAARAIAIVGMNPVSGMTLITVILACLLLVKVAGLAGPSGQILAISIGAAVCTALSMSGAFVTDLKIGYWLGATPRNQERLKFLAIAIASAAIIGVIWLLQKSYGFSVWDAKNKEFVSNPALPAPQANLIGAIVKSLMSNEAQPWMLYATGGILTLILEILGIPTLAFALGLYLPLGINLGILFGGIVSWIVAHSSKKEEIRKARSDKGVLIASGLVAGAALGGILSAVTRVPMWILGTPITYLSIGENFQYATEKGKEVLKHTPRPWFESQGMLIGALAILALAALVFAMASATRHEEGD